MHKIIILPFLSIPLLPTVTATSYCSKAGSIFWAKYYKKEPTFQAEKENQVIIKWQNIIPVRMRQCVELIELHEISTSSVSRPIKYLHGKETNLNFNIRVQHICTNSQRTFKIRFILMTNEYLDSKPFSYQPYFALSDRPAYCYQDRVLKMRLTRENIQPCIYQACYRGGYVQFKQGYTSLHKTRQTHPSENGIEMFVERVSKLVEITFWFADPEDFKSNIKKEILMNITDGHCDDLEDGNISEQLVL